MGERALAGDPPQVVEASARFAALLTAALGDPDRAQTLISVSAGLKHQVETRADYRARLTVAVRLLRAAAADSAGSCTSCGS